MLDLTAMVMLGSKVSSIRLGESRLDSSGTAREQGKLH
jgi:hypothetical protein